MFSGRSLLLAALQLSQIGKEWDGVIQPKPNHYAGKVNKLSQKAKRKRAKWN
ncbi:hypothetical protein MO867_20490 [Microbulbifer sp. OS29]|uniref:Uncharacterized protein n=1 Tax=Microbulbifer okhotskensis TaxID=2926617 RepID=A0A9X2EQQ7_9GAMM|nr:hypothetical protein [Microbulbifer okhotskensis]MCO1336709.1 hypothetical protein [Microbulbifer okhotskensis]